MKTETDKLSGLNARTGAEGEESTGLKIKAALAAILAATASTVGVATLMASA